ncbi:hypothetical protein AcW1_000859 [Taiwanofungus camphoratus]|nr:hypothetical protein AcV7_000878 [Antrodia cinnamomea]KAI0963905.1 hypothetical protein AcW1_000859 [Antrodia cinnamomea]
MASESSFHDHEPTGYSNDSGLDRRGHSYSVSTTRLLEPDAIVPRAGESTDSVYDSAYRPVFAEDNYDYDRGYSNPGYSTDTLRDKRDASLEPSDPNAFKESGNYQDLDYAEPPPLPPQSPSKTPNIFQRYFGLYPLEQRIADKQRGIGIQRHPFVVWALTVAMLGVLIYELVTNSKAQGTPFSFKPVVNPMLGPSGSALINVGARFPPCMKDVQGVPITTQFACPNDTANPPDRICSLEQICGFGGFHDETPNQSFRFIIPVFLHAGIIHYALNMLAQLTTSAQVEREMGSLTFLVLYMASGIFGNVLGGNFALVGSPSVGASGAIFGTTAVAWVDLFAHWRYQYNPVKKLMYMIIELIIGIAVGFIPYVDNFAHLGGLLMGLLVGMAFYPIISPSRRHKIIVLCFRLAAIPVAIVLFVVLTRNFYTSNPYAGTSPVDSCL